MTASPTLCLLLTYQVGHLQIRLVYLCLTSPEIHVTVHGVRPSTLYSVKVNISLDKLTWIE